MTAFRVDEYAGHDKSITVVGQGLTLSVDYDDVDHPYVDAAIPRLVEALNCGAFIAPIAGTDYVPFGPDHPDW